MIKRSVILFVFFLAISSKVFAAAPKTYQVTGPVLELNADLIVVQKGSERWEITRTPATKVAGDLKVGSKVTIEYRMMAASITVKPATAQPGAPGPKGK